MCERQADEGSPGIGIPVRCRRGGQIGQKQQALTSRGGAGGQFIQVFVVRCADRVTEPSIRTRRGVGEAFDFPEAGNRVVGYHHPAKTRNRPVGAEDGQPGSTQGDCPHPRLYRPHADDTAILVSGTGADGGSGGKSGLFGHGSGNLAHPGAGQSRRSEQIGGNVEQIKQPAVPPDVLDIPDAVKNHITDIRMEVVSAKSFQNQILVLDKLTGLGILLGLMLAYPQQLGDQPRGAHGQSAEFIVFSGVNKRLHILHFR